MKNINFLLFVIIILNLGCKKDNNCEGYACFTPPSPFLFELVDKSTNENLFTIGTYQSNQIEVFNTMNNSNVEFTFVDDNSLNLIQVNSIGWQTEAVNIIVKIADETLFNFYVEAERLNENRCSFTRYNEIRVENVDFELNADTGIHKIFIAL